MTAATLLSAAREGDLAKVQELLDTDDAIVDSQDGGNGERHSVSQPHPSPPPPGPLPTFLPAVFMQARQRWPWHQPLAMKTSSSCC